MAACKEKDYIEIDLNLSNDELYGDYENFYLMELHENPHTKIQIFTQDSNLFVEKTISVDCDVKLTKDELKFIGNGYIQYLNCETQEITCTEYKITSGLQPKEIAYQALSKLGGNITNIIIEVNADSSEEKDISQEMYLYIKEIIPYNDQLKLLSINPGYMIYLQPYDMIDGIKRYNPTQGVIMDRMVPHPKYSDFYVIPVYFWGNTVKVAEITLTPNGEYLLSMI